LDFKLLENSDLCRGKNPAFGQTSIRQRLSRDLFDLSGQNLPKGWLLSDRDQRLAMILKEDSNR
jgi:hypothetical protein